MQQAAQAYLQTDLSTDSPGRITLALYNGAVAFLNQAKEAMQAGDYARKGVLISKAMAIINELSAALNRDKGGEIAEKLRQLYFWCNARLAVANMRMNSALVDEVIKVLNGLRDAFERIQNTPEAQAAARQISAQQSAEGSQMRSVSVSPAALAGVRQAAPPAGGSQGARGRSQYGKIMALG